MVLIAFVLAIIAGLACGFFNGLIVTKFGTPPMIVTLGGQYLFMGIAIILTEGKPQLGFPEFFTEIGNGTVGGVIPIPLIFFIVIAVVTYYILQKTPYGLKLYLIGSNQMASRYSGLKVDSLLRKTYGAAGGDVGNSGLLYL
jgi:ribose/xylose/arabinose/galactoside ABC-type transport system permease subunit